ncbi:hypothetical protein [Pseudanabaena sp. UWO310]|uniref:hypothetical protein n=1 Tax=Pseudanabaena sp. UWO310 TaxID=2480795 RepID=UPI00115C2101|nr:hypothetical protein [Pseudanabaena sp. UWO310]TYQ30101.1 hypothetical protein PseudUWO310_10585 [Pseudanabaena sp. UWO310]
MTSTNDYQFWPFPVSEEERQIPEQAEKLDFLQDVYSDGFESYRAVHGLDDYGANSESRSGYILQRGRKNRWEFLLLEGGDILFSALVNCFKVAGAALRAWLSGRTTNDILENVKEYLISPPRLEDSWKRGIKKTKDRG